MYIIEVITCHRFIVRDFVYDTKAIKEERDEKGKLEIEMKKEFVSVISNECHCVNLLAVAIESIDELVEGELQSSVFSMGTLESFKSICRVCAKVCI